MISQKQSKIDLIIYNHTFTQICILKLLHNKFEAIKYFNIILVNLQNDNL